MMQHPPSEIRQVTPIERDIRLIVGGNFTPDALSPEVYQDVVDRVKARPREYLATFQTMFLGASLELETHSRLHLPRFLEIVVSLRPRDTRQTAMKLVTAYDGILAGRRDVKAAATFRSPDAEEEGILQRLHIRRHELSELVAGR